VFGSPSPPVLAMLFTFALINGVLGLWFPTKLAGALVDLLLRVSACAAPPATNDPALGVPVDIPCSALALRLVNTIHLYGGE
jgi:hypothetical protein